MFVPDKVLHRELGMLDILRTNVDELGMDYLMCDVVEPNLIDICIYAGDELFKEKDCDCVISYGSGSPMDAVKTIAAVAIKGKFIEKLHGFFAILRRTTTIFRVHDSWLWSRNNCRGLYYCGSNPP